MFDVELTCRKQYVKNTPHLDFLKDKFAEVADLPDQPANKSKPAAARPPAASRPASTAKPRKRQKCETLVGCRRKSDRGEAMFVV